MFDPQSFRMRGKKKANMYKFGFLFVGPITKGLRILSVIFNL